MTQTHVDLASATRCDLTELLVTDCAHCRQRDDLSWPARYEGHCAVCGGGILIDMLICWTEDGGRVQHSHHQRKV